MPIKGLPNIGLSCYMNSALQALYYIDEFRHFIVNSEYQNSSTLLYYLKCIFEHLAEEANESYEDLDFKLQIFKSYCGNFSAHQQGDANHFLTFLLNEVHKDLQNEFNSKSNEFNQGYENRELIANLFRGQIEYQMICCVCGYTENNMNKQFFYSLHVNPDIYQTNFTDWMIGFLLPCHIQDLDCCVCQEKNVYKHTSVTKWPPYLIISLNQVKVTDDGRMVKTAISTNIENEKLLIKPQTIDIAICTDKNTVSTEVEYDLQATINHYGNTEFGHYICTTKTEYSWILFDDLKFQAVERVDTRNSNVLFFKKVEPETKIPSTIPTGTEIGSTIQTETEISPTIPTEIEISLPVPTETEINTAMSQLTLTDTKSL